MEYWVGTTREIKRISDAVARIAAYVDKHQRLNMKMHEDAEKNLKREAGTRA